ncbi:uncharacterized protein LOC129595663 isoform X2 [Paramacrobiotus metropolitanus]|uniref:uncharacterized protein LOC129595663 isoform X2 n=1 Tax=Paramacrobiotus metropolitanus TaxID=2943436 RepID=UPI002446189B|nr:uncharacterized protein LOC129595663 isoform X2 [Paramacrobiotus metropolitanus]
MHKVAIGLPLTAAPGNPRCRRCSYLLPQLCPSSSIIFFRTNETVQAIIRNSTANSELMIAFKPSPQGVLVSFNGQRERLYRRTIHPFFFGTFRLDTAETKLATALLRTIGLSEIGTNSSFITSLSFIQGPFHRDNQFAIRCHTVEPFSYQEIELTVQASNASTFRDVHFATATQFRAVELLFEDRHTKLSIIYLINEHGNRITQKLKMHGTGASLLLEEPIEFSGDFPSANVSLDSREVNLFYERAPSWFYYGTYEEDAPRELSENMFLTLYNLDHLDWKKYSNESANCTADWRQRGETRRMRIAQDSAADIFQEGSCDSTMISVPLIDSAMRSFGTTDEKFDSMESSVKYENALPEPDVQLVFSYRTKPNEWYASKARYGFKLLPAFQDPLSGLKVTYTRLDNNKNTYERRQQMTILRFRRILSHLITGRFTLDGASSAIGVNGSKSEQDRKSSPPSFIIEIVQLAENEFRWIGRDNEVIRCNMTFSLNKHFHIGEDNIKTYWHYAEMGEKVVVKPYRDDSDSTMRELQVSLNPEEPHVSPLTLRIPSLTMIFSSFSTTARAGGFASCAKRCCEHSKCVRIPGKQLKILLC